jgi:hypothetical protein
MVGGRQKATLTPSPSPKGRGELYALLPLGEAGMRVLGEAGMRVLAIELTIIFLG